MKRSENWTVKSLVGRTRSWLAMAVLCGSVAAMLLIAQLVALATIVNDLAFGGRNFADETSILWVMAGLAVGRASVQWVADMLAAEGARRVTAQVRHDLVEHLFAVGPVGLGKRTSGEMVGLIIEGVDALEPYVAEYMPRAAMMLVLPFLVLALVARLDGWSFVVLLCTGPLIPIFMALVGYRAQAIMDRQWTQLTLLGSAFLDMLQGMTTLRLFGRAHDAVAAVAHAEDQYRITTMSVMRVAFLTSAVLEFFASLSIALVAVIFGSRLLAGHVDFRTAFLVLLLVPEYFMPLRAFSASYHARQNAVAAMARITELFALPARQSLPAAPPTTVIESITCERLAAGYEAGHPVLSDVTCTMRRGTMTLLVGESGAGKTTLTRLVLGLLQPTVGEVVARDAQGRAIGDWRGAIGWVPQRPRLIFGTVTDNLRLGDPMADMERLRHVAAQADALEFIEALPKGFDTMIGERGACLSGGQVQRLALARVLLRDPQVLVLDEPTAELDPQSERRIVASLARCAAGRIAIVVAHRTAMIAHGGQILHVAGGHVSPLSTQVAA